MLNPIRCVVICGTSVFAMAIEASLTERPDLAVVRLNPHLPDAAARITFLAPAAVIIERDGGSGDLALALLGRGFPLIELNLAQDTVTVLTGRQTPISQMSELAQVIEHIA
jgi:hypothetical protein